MRLYVTVKGQPAIVVGYGPGKNGPKAIVMGLGEMLASVSLEDCTLPKMPKKLVRKILAYVKAETRAAQAEMGGPH